MDASLIAELDINTTGDVRTFFEELARVGWGFHPDTAMGEYVDRASGDGVFSDGDAAVLDAAMERAFDVCFAAGADIYLIAVEVCAGPRLKVDGAECSLASFVEANAESHAVLDAVRAMGVGDVISIGGGAAPQSLIERVS